MFVPKTYKKIIAVLLIFLPVLFFVKSVFAITFSYNSTFLTNIGAGADAAISGAFIQPDGKIFIAGSFSYFNYRSAFHGVGRLNADGTNDLTFGSTSGLTGSGYGPGNSAGAVLYSSTGKTYVCGNFTHYNGVQKNFIVSLNDDGTINNSFVSGTGLANIGCRRIIEDSNNKLIIVGDFVSYNGSSVGAIARIAQDGVLDTSFNAGGVNYSSFGVHDVEALPNGKLMVGSNYDLTYNNVATGGLIRLNADGTRDATFNSGGVGFNGSVTEIERQSDGKLLIGGAFTTYNGTAANRIIRLNADGSIDTTFLTNIGTGLNGQVNYYDISIQDDKRIIIGGSFTSFNGNTANRIVRLNPDGTYDATFDTGTGFDNSVQGVFVDTDQSIIVTGSFTSFNGTTANRIVRIQTTDTADPVITEVTPITNPVYDQTPDYVFNSDEAGVVVVGGSCNNTIDFLATSGNNTITLDQLSQGTYSDCTLTLYDDAMNASNTLNIPTFEVIDQTPPALAEVTPVTTPTLDTTPSYTFSTDEAGDISYGGSCSSATTTAVVGNNTITFSSLSTGTYNDCTITVTDSANNASTPLTISSFVIADVNTFTISNVQYTALSNAHTIITWDTSYPATTYIEWGPDTNYGWNTSDNGLTTSHSALIDGLDADTTYHFRITAVETNSVSVQNNDTTFETLSFTGVKINYSPDSSPYTSVIDSNGNIYIGGDFSYVGFATNRMGIADLTTGQFDTDFTDTNGSVYASAPDGNGGWYIGGYFDKVQGVTRNNIAHLNPDGSLDTNWDASINSEVDGMVLYGNKLYVVGGFDSVNTNTTPVTRNYAAAFNLTTGAVDASWNPDLDSQGTKILINNDVVYISGWFSAVNQNDNYTSRNYAAAFDLVDGIVDPLWDPSLGGYVETMDIYDGKIYLGGAFTSVNTNTTPVTRNRLAAFDLTNGVVDATWNPNVNNRVYSIKVHNDKLYAGGRFTSVNTNTTPVSRNYIAAFDLTTGLVDATWNPNVDYYVYSVNVGDNKLYAAGGFYTVNQSYTPNYDHGYFAAFNLTDGTYDATFNPRIDSNGRYINISGNNVFIGGDFGLVNTVPRNYIYAIDSNGNLLDFDPDLDCTVYSLALSHDESSVFAGGCFSTVNQGTIPVTRNYIASFAASTGLVTDFDPDINGDVLALDISPDDNTVYAGGYFSSVNQNTTPVTRNNLAAFDTTTGLVTDFNPNINGQVGDYYGGQGIKLNSDGSILYTTGSFTTVNQSTTPITRNNTAAFDTSTGLVTSFNPNLNSQGSSLEFSLDESTVYISGYFDTVNQNLTPATRNYLAEFNSTTGLVTSFNPDFDYDPYTITLSKDGLTLYAGGDFYCVNSNNIEACPQYFAAINTTTGLEDVIYPVLDNSVYTSALSPDGLTLFIGGYFSEMIGGDILTSYIAKFAVTYTDNIAPVVSEVTPVSTPATDTTPNYTFTTDEAGTITYGGSCSSGTTSATIGNNTITFNTLTAGIYSNCTITVTDASNNISNTLAVSSFVINNTSSGSVAISFIQPPTNTQQTQTETKNEESNTENTQKETNIETKNNETNTQNNTETNKIEQNTNTETNNQNTEINTQNNTESSNSESGNTQNNSSSSDSTNSLWGNSAIGVEVRQFVSGAILNIKDSYKEASRVVGVAKSKTKEIVDDPATSTAIKVVGVVGVVASSSVSTASVLFLNPLSFSEIVMLPMRLWSLFLGLLGIRRKNKPWGVVYDAITKRPLDPAYVTLIDMNGEEVYSAITDLDGRYGFVAMPGKYRLVASKTNYKFPSVNLTGKTEDELYKDLYFSEIIEVKEENEIIGKNIPMDPINFDWNEFAKTQQNLNVFFKNKDLILAKITNILFPIGFAVSLVAFWAEPTMYNIFITLVYVAVFFLKKTILKPKPKANIKTIDGSILPFAILRFMNSGVEVAHKVADAKGNAYCLLPNGDYLLSVEKKNNDGTYTKVLENKYIEVKKGYFAGNIKI